MNCTIRYHKKIKTFFNSNLSISKTSNSEMITSVYYIDTESKYKVKKDLLFELSKNLILASTLPASHFKTYVELKKI